ncbi:DUF429 domain-containing protein [Haloferax sp. YSMS24]|uniref:DUF429 domain-containing protein n=1 Tax=Haloferax sp. YSMS24 TaxID=3388425 RepID=UPI00398CE903
MSESPTVVGVDGCRSGWVCGCRSADGLTVRVVPDFETVWTDVVSAETRHVLVDIPIGLPSASRRACDVEARRRLGSRASTVFFAPVRSVLDAPTHERASAENRDKTGYGLSIQAWNLVPKIRAVDSVLGATPRARALVSESHPELAFAAFAGGPLTEPKSTAAGRRRRLDMLRTAMPDDDPETVYHETVDRTLRRELGRDDILDALVLTAAAQFPLEPLPNDPPTDATGLEMAIYAPRVPTPD